MTQTTLHLGEPADEADWRALVEKGLRGAGWDRLTGRTADGIALKPLYREPDCGSARDEAGFPGAAPFVRGGAGWTIRQSFAHPDPEQTNREILSDLQGGVGAIELVIDPKGKNGVAITDAAALDRALAGVIPEAAPISLDAGASGLRAAELLEAKLKGVAAPGTAFNLDPIGALMRTGSMDDEAMTDTVRFTAGARATLPAATALRIDARPVHEAGGTEAQEVAVALGSGIEYLRALAQAGVNADDAASTLQFALATGPDVLVEVAKLRALRLCWARVQEASGAAPEHRGARIHAFTSRRMMTRADAETNILRVTTAAFAAAISGANDITTYPFTDALGLPTPFARRVARNTQLVLMEEAHLDQVADPAGGAWFVETLTRELAAKAWAIMQDIESRGGIVASLRAGHLQALVAAACAAQQAVYARRKQTITGVTDFPLLGQKAPDFVAQPVANRASFGNMLSPMRWAAPFETLRERAEGRNRGVFFANLGALAEFSPRATFAQNLIGVGGVATLGADAEHASLEALCDAFKRAKVSVAVVTGTDARYAEHAANTARALKQAGATWVVLAGKPSESEAAWRGAGVDQFVFVGIDTLKELETLHAALGLAP